MASQSFRDSIGSFGWSRREQDIPVNTAQRSGLLSSIRSLNPFGDGGYVRLPTTESQGAPLPAPSRREEEEGWFVCESKPFLSRSFSLPLLVASSSAVAVPLQQTRRQATRRLRVPCLKAAHEHTVSALPHLSSETDDSCLRWTVSRWDRMLVFAGCNLGALACFVICFALFPLVVHKPSKFVLL